MSRAASHSVHELIAVQTVRDQEYPVPVQVDRVLELQSRYGYPGGGFGPHDGDNTAGKENRVAVTDFVSALNSTTEIELMTIGRVSGREISRPVWFVRRDEKLYLLPLTGSQSQWYKNLLSTPVIRLAAHGTQYSGTGNPVIDPGEVSQVIDDFRGKYGAREVAGYYTNPDVAVEVTLS